MKLYGYRNGRTLRALWTLEELELKYEYVEVDVMRSAGQQPWFLKINRGGKVPVLDDGGTVITESAAICLHLAEKHPERSLLPKAGIERTACYKWISFVLTEMDASLWTIAKHRFGLPAERRVPAVIETAGWEFRQAVKILAADLGDRSYLVPDRFTVADIVAAHTLLWARSARLAFSDSLSTYLDRLLTRPAAVRARAMAPTLPTSSSLPDPTSGRTPR